MDVAVESAADVCELWLSRCSEALAACNADEITTSYVAAGAAAWDDCCGTLIAAPERVYRTVTFPLEGQSNDPCETAELAVDVVILLLRCVPTIDDKGRVPGQDKLIDAYQRILGDAATIWNAVRGELPEGWLRANISQTFVGAEGGCIGVETRFTIGLPQEDWCPCP